jgi:hypothetical protein
MSADALAVRSLRGSAATTIAFRCPRCEQRVVRDITSFHAAILRNLRIPIVEWDPPAELAERHQGPPITLDDLLDAHLVLAGEGWREDLDRACAQARPGAGD